MKEQRIARTIRQALAPILLVWRKIARAFASDSLYLRCSLRGDELSRFLSISKLTRQEAKVPRSGSIKAEDFVSLLPELAPRLAEDIARGRQLVSETVLFSIWPSSLDDADEDRATIVFVTMNMIHYLPIPDTPIRRCCYRCFSCTNYTTPHAASAAQGGKA